MCKCQAQHSSGNGSWTASLMTRPSGGKVRHLRSSAFTIEVDNAPPIVLVCKAFLEFVVRWMKTRTRGAACCDTTWKMNVAEWGLFVIAGMATHYVAAAGHRRGMGLPFSMTFGPKEDQGTLYCSIKATFAFYEKHFGIELIPFLSVVMWDATLAGAAAHRQALPKTDYARDLRHQLAKARDTAPSKCEGEAETKGVAAWLVIGSLTFSAFNLWVLESFDEHWEAVQARLITMKQFELVKWLEDHVLFWNKEENKWDAHWRSGPMSSRRPGESTYLPQVLESLHDTIKDALPQNIHLKEPTTAIRKLSSALEAIATSRNWIAPAAGAQVEEKWVFTGRMEEDIAPQTYAAGTFSPRYVYGPRLVTEHLLTEDEEQRAKLTMDSLIEYMPENYKKCPLKHPYMAELYVVPLYHADLRITDDMLTATQLLLFPGTGSFEDRRKAQLAMGIYIQENGGVRYSMSGSRLFHNSVCPVLVLRDGSVVCGCQANMVGAECGHGNFIRYLRQTLLRDEFAPMKALTQSQKKRSVAVGRPAGVPSNAARLTMQDIRDAAKERQAKRAAAKKSDEGARKRFLRAAFSSPERESVERTAKQAKDEAERRAKIVYDISRGLENVQDYSRVYRALHLCRDSRLLYEEALNSQFSIGKKIVKVAMRMIPLVIQVRRQWLKFCWLVGGQVGLSDTPQAIFTKQLSVLLACWCNNTCSVEPCSPAQCLALIPGMEGDELPLLLSVFLALQVLGAIVSLLHVALVLLRLHLVFIGGRNFLPFNSG